MSSLFDLKSWHAHRDKAASDFARFDFLKRLATTRLMERLDIVKPDFDDIIDFGCHTGEVGQALPDKIKGRQNFTLTQIDVSSEFVAIAARTNPFASKNLVFDGEILPIPPASCDAMISVLFMHWMHDLPGILTQMRFALRPEKLLLVNLLGGRSLGELRACLSAAESEILGGISPHVMPMADIRDCGSLLQRAGFTLPVADAEMITIHYADMFALMRDMKGMGGGNALTGRQKHVSRKDIFRRAAELYAEKFSTHKGEIRASIELITLTGWSPA